MFTTPEATISEVSLTPVIDNDQKKDLNTSRLELYVPLGICNYLRERSTKETDKSVEEKYNEHPNKDVLKVLLERKKNLLLSSK